MRDPVAEPRDPSRGAPAPPAPPASPAPGAVSVPDALGVRSGPLAWVEYALVRGVLGIVTRLPWSWQLAIAGGLARLARRLARRHSDAARSFLRQALGCARSETDLEERVLQAWRHFFTVTLEGAALARRIPRERMGEHFVVERCEGLDEALAHGGGLLCCPHLGSWESAAVALPHLGFAPAWAVARPPRNRPLSAWFLRVRRAWGVGILPRRGGIQAAVRLLRAGAWVALLPDQRPLGRHVVAPFFGRPAPCERGVAALVQRLRVPVVVGACYRTERPFHYRVRLARVFGPDELADLPPEEILARINAEMEALILAAPEQYFWLHDRYRGLASVPEP